MSNDLVYIPSPISDGYVSLTKTAQGRLLRKQILPMNQSFVHPGDKSSRIFVDAKMAKSLVDNFNAGRSIVQVPIVNDNNQHVEDPLRNAGEVIDLEYDDTGVYATIDARKFADDFGSTILGASAFMHLDYTDTKTGAHVGPTLLHVAATNRPYINDLDGFKDILKASADISDEQPILLTAEIPAESGQVSLSGITPVEEGQQMTYDELLAELKDKHNVDVAALQASATEAAALSAQLEDVNNQLQLSAEGAISANDVAEALVELSNSNKSLVSTVETLKADNEVYKLNAATAEVDGLIRTGRVLPAQKDVMVRLSMTDRDTFDAIVPDTAIVSLSEHGVTVHENPADNTVIKQNVDRYTAMLANNGVRSKNRA